ncbi:MAG: iron ABC transporter permease [Dehalococcoidia bacterium]|nr:iron ABC transporter permease [Dehalococcoidia bacterium]
MLLPIAYLVIRTAGAGEEALQLLLRGRTVQVLVNTSLLALSVTVATSALGIALAWLTVRTDLPLRRLWTVLLALPLAVPSYVGGFVLISAFGPRGMLQQLLAPLGVARLPDIYGFPGAMLALTLFSYPYVLLSVRGALSGMDSSPEEASRSLGCSPAATFWRVVLPQLKPATAAGALLVVLYTLSDFGAVSLLRFESFTYQIYLQYQGSFDRTLAAVFSLVLVCLTVVVLFSEGRARGRAAYYRSTVGSIRPPRLVPLGRWRWPALAFCGLTVTAALALPVLVLFFWLAQGIVAGQPLHLVWRPALNSAYASGLATAVMLAAAIPVAVLAVRYRGRLSVLIERATYIGFALPGIVIALSLVFFGVRYATPLYQTMAMLVFAYVVRFLPQAVGATRASLLQVNPRVEDAARSLGYSVLQTLARITIPLVRRGLLGGAGLVFLTTVKELPATLILSPIGFDTLATSIWGATSEGLFARAAVPALLLILISLIPMALMVTGEESGR